MYYGKMTKELKELCIEYEKKFDGSNPCGYMELEYGQEDYEDFIADIKTSIDTGIEVPDLYPPFEEEIEEKEQSLTELQKKFKEEYEKLHYNK